MLQALEASNLLLIPLDRTREWYRYHHLLGDALRSRLHHAEPEREIELQARASEWWEAHGDIDRAVMHAAHAGDEARFDVLVWQYAPMFLGSGRSATVLRWLEGFAADEIARRPALVVIAAWCGVTSGDPGAFDQWAQIATAVTPDVPLPDGTPLGAALSMLHATSGRRGIVRMRVDAARAYRLNRGTSPFRGVARFMEGAALRLSGDLPAARVL